MIKQEEMNRQEKIWDGITKKLEHYYGDCGIPHIAVARVIAEYLHSQGVVIKVDKKPPDLFKDTRVLFEPESSSKWYRRGAQDYWAEMVEAGYVAVESLIEEKK